MLLAASPSFSQLTPPPDESRAVGRALPDVELTNDRGETFRLSSLEGLPLVLSPVFTRCPHACVMITSSLRDALVAIGPPGDDYNVITLTFDPEDTVGDLRSYRERFELPDGWVLARAEPAALDTLLSTIDFHYSPVAGGGFVHANVVAVITPDLRVSGYVHGLDYSEQAMRRALLSAVTPPSLVDEYKPYMALAAGLALLAVFVTLWATRKRRPS